VFTLPCERTKKDTSATRDVLGLVN